ncbi:hypothetical protein TNCV_3785581 [Trichonephila clavipes]|nr:hypothetical protein TNCV_3785581 [Trichonephila clavipes]
MSESSALPPSTWHSEYPNLNPSNIYLWGYLKVMVYPDLITSQSDIKESIERIVPYIVQFMLLSTVDRAVLRFQRVADNGGQHIEHVL